MRYRIAAVAAVLAMLAVAPGALAGDRLPLRPGSSGPRVAAAQWLLTGKRPNVFTKVKGTYPASATRGYWGARTTRAVLAYKWRLGYPKRLVTPVVGPYFFALTQGRATRPVLWVALAARRLQTVEPGVSTAALRIRALENSQLGTVEVPWGSNRGPKISYPVGTFHPSYQSSTGAYAAPWCVSFQQWAFSEAGPGTFADRSAGVYYVRDWSARRSLLYAKPKVGRLVLFLDDGGHIGYVVKVLAAGYVTDEGNSHNSVRQVYHPWNDRLRVFVGIPGVSQ